MSNSRIFSKDFHELLTDCEKGIHTYEIDRTKTINFKKKKLGISTTIVTYCSERTFYECKDCGKQRFEDENVREISRRNAIFRLF